MKLNYDEAADAIEDLIDQLRQWQATTIQLAGKLARTEAGRP